MTGKRIYLCLARMGGLEQKYIAEAFNTNWIAPLGPNVDAFEKLLEERLGGSKHVAALSSGTAALHLALVLLGVDKGDEVICQSWTFAASANPIVYMGATPIFVDSENETWNICPELLRKAVIDRISKNRRKPKAIVIAEMYGMPAKLDEIVAIAKEFDIPLVEDSAEAFGSRYNGRMCGTFGDYGILSFNGNKMITTSGGGAIVCHTEEAKKRALFYATQAREPFPYYQHEKIGYNYRMSNICAGIGRGQMAVLQQHIDHHKEIAAIYAREFSDAGGIEVHLNPSERFDSNYWLTTIIIDSEKTGCDPEMLRRHLDDIGVETRPLWKPMHLQPVYKDAPAYINGLSGRLFPSGLCLPSGPWVTEEDAVMIAREIKRKTHVAV